MKKQMILPNQKTCEGKVRGIWLKEMEGEEGLGGRKDQGLLIHLERG